MTHFFHSFHSFLCGRDRIWRFIRWMTSGFQFKRKSCNAYLASTIIVTWWRHQMETFSALLALCAGNSPVPGEFPAQRPVTRSFDVFFDLCLNKRLSKQSWGWWFETLLCPLWRHCNEQKTTGFMKAIVNLIKEKDMTTPWHGNTFPITGPFWEEPSGHLVNIKGQ